MDVNSVGLRSRPKNRIREADHRLILMLPDGCLLRVIARSVLLVMAIIVFPWLGSIVGSSVVDYRYVGFAIDDYSVLPALFGDLSNEGLIRSGYRAVVVGEEGRRWERILSEMEMDLVSESDPQRSIPDDALDFVFAGSFAAVAGFIDRVLKIGGIVAVRMDNGHDGCDDFWVPPNYKIVYVRRFDATVVVMQKTGQAALQSQTKMPLCGVASDAKKAAISGLEDVLLEPPLLNSVELDQYVERTRYFPDLMVDSLEGYPRRVFVDVGLGGIGIAWFERHYPTRSQSFEKYTVGEDWLGRNVAEEAYVVVKAEVDVVEKMVKSKAICLVDELFLDCKHQGQKGSRRAYWECLALLGQLRNEGIAVHQWWG